MDRLMKTFDPLEPFESKLLLKEVLSKFKNLEYKLYGRIPIKFHRGKPTKYEFDLNLGVMHFTELDFQNLSKIFKEINSKWKTQMTYCIYPAKNERAMIINIRGSPKAPSELG